MPVTPTSDNASRTSSSLKGLMTAMTIFMRRLRIGRGGGRRSVREGRQPASTALDFLNPAAASSYRPHTPAMPNLAPFRSPAMIDLKTIDDLARRLNDLVPPGLKDARA